MTVAITTNATRDFRDWDMGISSKAPVIRSARTPTMAVRNEARARDRTVK